MILPLMRSTCGAVSVVVPLALAAPSRARPPMEPGTKDHTAMRACDCVGLMLHWVFWLRMAYFFCLC